MNTFTSATLIRVLAGLDMPQTFLLDGFFPDIALFDDEKVYFDRLERALGLAPFVSPLARGMATAARGFQTDSFTPAYVKPKNEVTPNRVLKRRPGEALGGAMSAQARRDAIIADLLLEQMQKIRRRKEWMASSVLRTGAVTVAGENFPAVTVDFGRAAGHTITLTSGARWGEAGVEPLDDIEAWADTVAIASGAAAQTVVMDPKAWALARKSPRMDKQLDFRRVMGGEVQTGPLARGQERWGQYVGSVGQFDFHVYSQPFVDEAGSAGNMMPDHTVILGAMGAESGVAGYQAQGAIMDPRAGYQAVEMWPKNWIDEDPATEWVMTQSAPS